MQKLELIDAEKRARRSDVQRCGVNSLLVNEIPFGVRALQRGVEVEGIWISNSNTPELSQVASSTTLIGEDSAKSKGKSRARNREASGDPSESTGSSTDEAARAEPPIPCPHIPVTTRLRCVAQPHFDSSDVQSTITAPLRSHLDSYVPSGTRLQPERRHRPPDPLAGHSQTVESHIIPTISGQNSHIRNANAVQSPDNHSTNRETEIRPERRHVRRDATPNATEDDMDVAVKAQSSQPRRHRLSRKPPRSQLREKA